MNDLAILLVEDDRDDEELTLKSLTDSGISNRVDVARTGPEALDYLFGQRRFANRDTSKLPALMVLDIGLPKLTGLEVLKHVRADERTKLLPVVILTSSDNDEDRLQSYELGANSYVRKPVEFGEFCKAVVQVGLYWLVCNQGPPQRKPE